MLVILWLMMYDISIIQGFSPSKTSPELLDSLVMPVEIDSFQEVHEDVGRDRVDQRLLSESVKRPQHDKNTGNNRRNQYVSPLGSIELGEANCPNTYCFTFRNLTSKHVQLECKSSVASLGLASHKVIDRVHCRYWKNPTTPTGIPGAGLDLNGPSTSEGRGFDLKIILSPSIATELSSEGSERRLQIDELTPGLLIRLIRTLRTSLHMQQSPVHLTISFIYINKLRRVDLGDLSTLSHVTRLSLWNPFEWDEDSLIPDPISADEMSPMQSPTRMLIPPYFRLTVFCDHANRNPSFRRLWLPWKSWQVRFNHCHDLYVCRTWLSKYPICDNPKSDPSSRQNYMPSSFLMPKIPELDMTTLDTSPRTSTSLSRNRADNQILYENQCQIEPSPMDPVDDLKLDYERSCWQPGAYQPHQIGDALEFVLPDADQTSPERERIESDSMELHGSSRSTTTSTPTITNATRTEPIELEMKTRPVEIIQPKMTPTITTTTKNTTITTRTTTTSTTQKPPHSATPSSAIQFDLSQSENSPSNVSRGISQTYLTTAVIILSVLVIILLLSLVILILWIKSRHRERETKWKSTGTNGFLPYVGTSAEKQRYPPSPPQHQQQHVSDTRQSSMESTPQLISRQLASSAHPTATIQYTPDSIRGLTSFDMAQTRTSGQTRTDKHDGTVWNGTRPPVYGGHMTTDTTVESGNQRPPPTPKHRSGTRRVRRASHPSESPSLQRKQSGSAGSTNPDNAESTRGRRTPIQEHHAQGLNSSQGSLRSRSRTRLDHGALSSSRSRLTDSSPALDPHFSNADTVHLRSEQSPTPRMKKRKYSPIRQPRKQHTLVFEDGDLDEEKWPIGLRQSFKKP